MTPEQHLIELNQQIVDAEKEGNGAYLSEILAPDLMFLRANGNIDLKQDYLRGVVDLNNTYSRLESADIEPKIKDQVAVVSLQVIAAGMRGAIRLVACSGIFACFEENPSRGTDGSVMRGLIRRKLLFQSSAGQGCRQTSCGF
jgi:hypothetical protein